MRERLTVREGKSSGLFRTFAICNAETQEPLEGFDGIVGNDQEVTEYAKRLTLLEDPQCIEALRQQIEKRSDRITHDFYGHIGL